MKEIEFLNKTCPLYKNKNSKRELRHDFFKEIKTEVQAYLLGFIMSDGSVNDERHTLAININKKDKEILDIFKIISPQAYEQEVRSYESKALVRGHTVKNSGSVKLTISSVVLINDLKKYGIIQNKTYFPLPLPNLPNNLMLHFIRGYFDGDGCFTFSVRKPNINNREVNYRVSARFELYSKTNNLFLELQKWLSINYNILLNINYIKRDDMYKIITSSKQTIISLYHLLYDNAHYYLERKFNKFNYYVNTEVTQIISEHRNAQKVNVNESNNPSTSTEQLY